MFSVMVMGHPCTLLLSLPVDGLWVVHHCALTSSISYTHGCIVILQWHAIHAGF